MLCPQSNICWKPGQTVFLTMRIYTIIYFVCWCSVSPAAGAVSHRSEWSVRENLRPADAQPAEGYWGGGGGRLTRQLGQVFLRYAQMESLYCKACRHRYLHTDQLLLKKNVPVSSCYLPYLFWADRKPYRWVLLISLSSVVDPDPHGPALIWVAWSGSGFRCKNSKLHFNFSKNIYL